MNMGSTADRDSSGNIEYSLPEETIYPLGHDSAGRNIGVDSTGSVVYLGEGSNSNFNFQYDDTNNLTFTGSGSTGNTLYFNLEATQPPEPPPERSCPIHGDLGGYHMSFNFPEHGINETYCLICLRDALRKIMNPLDEGGGEVPQEPKEPGVSFSRYDIAKQSDDEDERVA